MTYSSTKNETKMKKIMKTKTKKAAD